MKSMEFERRQGQEGAFHYIEHGPLHRALATSPPIITANNSTPKPLAPSMMATALRPSLLRQRLPAFRSHPAFRIQRAAFQTTPIRAILPPLPQKIEGTVNDPVKVPEAEPGHGSYHWTAERVVSAALIPMTIAPFAAGALSPMMDGIFIAAILVHSHLGFDSVITDYAPKWRVPTARKLLNWARNLALVVVGWGWYEFETNDVGLTEGVRRVWTA